MEAFPASKEFSLQVPIAGWKQETSKDQFDEIKKEVASFAEDAAGSSVIGNKLMRFGMSQFNPAAVQEAERSLNLRFRQPHAQNDRMLAISMVGEDSQSERIRFSVSTAIYRRAHPEARGLAICLEGCPRTRSAALQRGKRRVLRKMARACRWRRIARGPGRARRPAPPAPVPLRSTRLSARAHAPAAFRPDGARSYG